MSMWKVPYGLMCAQISAVSAFLSVKDTSVTGEGDVSVAIKGGTRVIFYEQGLARIPTPPLYDSPKLRPSMAIDGPAIIEFVDTTVVLRAGDPARVDRLGSIEIDL